MIVALGGQETPDFEELGQALRAHQAGDAVSVELVRGQEQETVEVTLGQRPQPDVPDSAKALAERLTERHREVNEELQAAVAGLAEKEAKVCPDEGEWSVKQVLAHLVENEEAGHVFLFNIAANGWLDGGNVSYRQYPGRVEALLAVTPTVRGLLDRYLTAHAETMEMLRRLPKETVAHKARFRRIAEFELFGPDHVREHVGQIQNIVEALGKGYQE